MTERLQKILSARGVASRRKAEEMIEQGLVTVNGMTARLGDTADADTDEISRFVFFVKQTDQTGNDDEERPPAVKENVDICDPHSIESKYQTGCNDHKPPDDLTCFTHNVLLLFIVLM